MIKTTLKRTENKKIPIHPVNPIEDVGVEKVKDDPNMEVILNLFEYSMGFEARTEGTYNLFRKLVPALKPETISNWFEYLMVSQQITTSFEIGSVGLFFSALIQKSFGNGYNDFRIDTNYFSYFGCRLEGLEDRLLKIHVERDESNNSFSDSKYLNLHLNVAAGESTCWYTKNSEIHVNEIVKDNCYFGERADMCDFFAPNEETIRRIEHSSVLTNFYYVNDNLITSESETSSNKSNGLSLW